MYCLEYFKQYVKKDEWVFFNLKRPLANLEKLDWSESNLRDVLLGIRNSNWQKTVKDCIVNDLEGYRTIDSDQYEVHWHEENCISMSRPQNGTVSLSMKIAVISDVNGECSGVVTFNTSGS